MQRIESFFVDPHPSILGDGVRWRRNTRFEQLRDLESQQRLRSRPTLATAWRMRVTHNPVTGEFMPVHSPDAEFGELSESLLARQVLLHHSLEPKVPKPRPQLPSADHKNTTVSLALLIYPLKGLSRYAEHGFLTDGQRPLTGTCLNRISSCTRVVVPSRDYIILA
jgi:hypothetical protein